MIRKDLHTLPISEVLLAKISHDWLVGNSVSNPWELNDILYKESLVGGLNESHHYKKKKLLSQKKNW